MSMSNKPARPAPDQPRDPDAFPETESPSRNQPPSSSSLRGIIDALLQASLVDLFQAYGVACAPLPRDGRSEPERYPDLSASIGFTSSNDGKSVRASGRLTLSMSPQVLELMQGERALPVRHSDWSRELVNQLMGRFKNRLLPYGANLQAGLPTSSGREALETGGERALGRRVYRARTVRGEVVATLDGSLHEAGLSYVGPASAGSEGELILF
jgi:hypothetical protein